VLRFILSQNTSYLSLICYLLDLNYLVGAKNPKTQMILNQDAIIEITKNIYYHKYESTFDCSQWNLIQEIIYSIIFNDKGAVTLRRIK
jgi:hypothetical protein